MIRFLVKEQGENFPKIRSPTYWKGLEEGGTPAKDKVHLLKRKNLKEWKEHFVYEKVKRRVTLKSKDNRGCRFREKRRGGIP